MSATIEAEIIPQSDPDGKQPPTMAVATRAGMAVGQALTVEQLHERLEFIRNVMKREMREDQDFGKIPGTGDKPSLLQPGAQKLLMTFNLREQIRKEVLREIPHSIYGHREYEFTVVVFPAGLKPEDGWDGVGTCSTMESKYRYRKATRKCPKCGAEAIIEEKAEFVKNREPGWVCWKKRNGCGELFHKNHDDITKQSLDDVENEDPADVWNTVRKMAFKRALVAAAINATNTSELWTQDVEDMVQNQGRQKAQNAKTASGARGGVSTSTHAGKVAPAKPQEAGSANKSTSPATRPAQPAVFADDDTRNRLISQLKDCSKLATEYFQKVGCLMDNEGLEDLPLRFVPVTRRQFQALQSALAGFGNGEEATGLPYPPNPEAEPVETKPPKTETKPPTKPPQTATKAPAAPPADKKRDPAWFFGVICPIPYKGMKRDEYLKQPDTIGSLYKSMKEGDEGAQKRLWGFAKHWKPEPRTVGNRTYPVSPEEVLFREALDDFCDWEERHGKDTQADLLPRPAGVTRHQPKDAADERDQAQAEADQAEDDVPF